MRVDMTHKQAYPLVVLKYRGNSLIIISPPS